MARFISTLGYAPPSQLSILILTDDIPAGRDLVAGLAHMQLAVRCAPSRRLDRMLAAETPDVIVVDWGTTGAEVLERIRRTAAHIPVLAIAPGPAFEERLPILELGVDYCVWRPFDVREIAVRARVASETAARQRAIATKVDAMRLWHDWVRYLVHDLRSPVTVAMSAVAMAMDSPADELAENLTAADRALGEITSMLRDILDTDRIKHGALSPVRQEVDLAQLARDVAIDSTRHAVHVTGSGNTSIAGDPVLLRRVLGNLVANATRHVRARPIEVSVTGTAHGVSARVVNDGPGIEPAVRPHLFEPWQQVAGLHAGTGIGLAFCRLVCEAHGGTIWLDNPMDGEVAFAFGLPRVGS
jgi:two-component system, sensor histidine kinase and response regulator